MRRDARELAVPPTAAVDAEAIEILRAWVTKGNLEVGLIRAWDQPDPWGVLLVDLARHAARAFAQEGICTESDALERIRTLFNAEWDRPTDIGSTQQVTKQ